LVAICALCGTGSRPNAADDSRTESDTLPLTWVTSVDGGEARVFCDRCARDHLRSIESRLDSEWW
jgi:hypothetical protein